MNLNNSITTKNYRINTIQEGFSQPGNPNTYNCLSNDQLMTEPLRKPFITARPFVKVSFKEGGTKIRCISHLTYSHYSTARDHMFSMNDLSVNYTAGDS